MTEHVRTALITSAITGAIGIIGVVSGAWIANEGQQDVQEAETRRINARESAAARGSARLLMQEIGVVRANALASGDDARWWPLDYRVDVAVEDRKLLAAKLTADRWEKLLNALALTDYLSVARRDGFQWKSGADSALDSGPTNLIHSEDMDIVVRASRAIDKALEALKSIAGVRRIPAAFLTREPERVRRYALASGIR